MIGTPMPRGVLVARRPHVDRIASANAYLRSDDTTMIGSRNGHAVLALWARLHRHGAAGFRADVAAGLARTDRLVAALRADYRLVASASGTDLPHPFRGCGAAIAAQ